jgi:RNA polymerase sigma factor (sigma-70 family)
MLLRELIRGATGKRCALARARTDPDAFAAFYDAYDARVLVFFTRRVLDVELALDLTAETFAQAWENRAQFRGVRAEEEQGWLFALARTQLSRYWRRGRVEREALFRLAVEVPTLSDAEIDRVERMAGLGAMAPRLAGALASLPQEQKRAVELRVIGELEYSVVAAQLGVSEQAARARVSRGLRAMGLQLASFEEIARETA